MATIEKQYQVALFFVCGLAFGFVATILFSGQFFQNGVGKWSDSFFSVDSTDPSVGNLFVRKLHFKRESRLSAARHWTSLGPIRKKLQPGKALFRNYQEIRKLGKSEKPTMSEQFCNRG